MLSTTEMLFIRACKSKNPHVRVLSVYKRYYLFKLDPPPDIFIVSSILMSLILKLKLHNDHMMMDMIHKLRPHPTGQYPNELFGYTYEERLFGHVISAIRFTHINKFPSNMRFKRHIIN